jgi:hypothetical protein
LAGWIGAILPDVDARYEFAIAGGHRDVDRQRGLRRFRSYLVLSLRLLAADLLDDPRVSRGRLDSPARGDLGCQQPASLEVELAFARGG